MQFIILYEKNSKIFCLFHFIDRQQILSQSLVTEWFIQRAKEIEAKTGLVENALELIKLGIQRNIQVCICIFT